jgi:hypothetical protein
MSWSNSPWFGVFKVWSPSTLNFEEYLDMDILEAISVDSYCFVFSLAFIFPDNCAKCFIAVLVTDFGFSEIIEVLSFWLEFSWDRRDLSFRVSAL